MARLTDIIEDFLKEMLEESGGYVEVRRNALADSFKCSPSQINYVLETRFQPQMGYYIESRRGGGGYISIEKINLTTTSDFESMLVDTIGDSATASEVDLILDSLRDSGIITKRESAIIASSLSDRSLDVRPGEKNMLRASILKNILLVLAKESEDE